MTAVVLCLAIGQRLQLAAETHTFGEIKLSSVSSGAAQLADFFFLLAESRRFGAPMGETSDFPGSKNVDF